LLSAHKLILLIYGDNRRLTAGPTCQWAPAQLPFPSPPLFSPVPGPWPWSRRWRLAGGAAWPTYSRGSPAGPAKGGIGAVTGRSREGGARQPAAAQGSARGSPRRSGPAMAGGGGVVHRGQGAQVALGRATVQLEPTRRQPAAGAAATHGRPRRRSTFPVAVAQEKEEEGLGDDE
jgi:hypothetical protein